MPQGDYIPWRPISPRRPFWAPQPWLPSRRESHVPRKRYEPQQQRRCGTNPPTGTSPLCQEKSRRCEGKLLLGCGFLPKLSASTTTNSFRLRFGDSFTWLLASHLKILARNPARAFKSLFTHGCSASLAKLSRIYRFYYGVNMVSGLSGCGDCYL